MFVCFTIAMFVAACITKNDAHMIASSIFGVAGAIEILATKFSKK